MTRTEDRRNLAVSLPFSIVALINFREESAFFRQLRQEYAPIEAHRVDAPPRGRAYRRAVVGDPSGTAQNTFLLQGQTCFKDNIER